MCQIIDRTFLHTLSQNDFLDICIYVFRFRPDSAFSRSSFKKERKFLLLLPLK